MLNRLREWWEGLGRSNQMIAGGATLASLVALIGFVAWANTPEYVPLFSNLSAQDANAISDKLREANVPFRLANSGAVIEVPAQKRDEMRMKLLSENLPQDSSATTGPTGYGVLKEANIGQTSTMESQTILRAHEGEIAKSILNLNQVSGAIVHIAPGEDSPFASSKTMASASVVLTLKPGQQLDADNVRAILRLVQMSYTGLNEDKITITDSHAMLLHDPMHANGDAADIHKDEVARSQAKSAELQAVLDQTIGPNKARVLANVELNPDRKTTEETNVTPGVVTEQHTESEKMQGSPDSGTPPAVGATANLAGIPDYAKKNADGAGNYVREIATKTSTPTITKNNIVSAPGRIEKLTVSALVDTRVPPEQLDAIKNTLMTAIGATPTDATRMVTVAQVPFDHTAEEEEAKAANAARSADNTAKMLTSLVPLALMAISLFLLYRALRKPQPRLAGQLALAGAGGEGSLALEGGMMAYGPDGNPLPGQTVDSLLNPEINAIGISTATGDPHTFEIIEEAFDAHLESIQHLVKSKPETVAALIRSWTTEEK